LEKGETIRTMWAGSGGFCESFEEGRQSKGGKRGGGGETPSGGSLREIRQSPRRNGTAQKKKEKRLGPHQRAQMTLSIREKEKKKRRKTTNR